jgi:hypothetical protein
LEAFTDGVLAIVITIMVLESKTPDGYDFAAIIAALPAFLAYALSYVMSALSGTTTITSCRPPSASTGVCYGPISFYCSACR